MEFLQIAATSFFSAAALFIITKIMGRKQVSQLDFFDYVTGITFGSIAAEMATELEEPLKPLVAMAVYGVVSVVLSIVGRAFPGSRKYLNGEPVILMDHGYLYRENMKKVRVELNEFLMMCRQEGYFDLAEVETAVFEYNGHLTILPVSGKKPITADDLGMCLPPAGICREVIMDGKIMDENLRKMGLNRKWLENQLHGQKYGSAAEVFLGVCNAERQLTLYPKKVP